MGNRQREWARRVRDELITKLGGKCQRCGSTDELEFDHICGEKPWVAKDKEWSHRISIYRKEAMDGKLQLLCSVCNRMKGSRLQVWKDGTELESEPF